ncbi:MAG: hypothetical protein KJZ87_06390 [Thermoguttaceae bacterium]|nr:hypothetical protein [Thermoguttaceae bacterium]
MLSYLPTACPKSPPAPGQAVRATARLPARPEVRGRVACAALAPVLLVLVCHAGCAGYQVGNWTLYSDGIETVYVPVFESDSFRHNLGELLTEAVAKEIERVTPYKVVGSPAADSILRGRIVTDAKNVVVEDPHDNPRELELTFQVQVQWVDRRGRTIQDCGAIPLPPEMTLVGASATIIPEVGETLDVAQLEAVQEIAEQIVAMMETPW